MTTEKPIVLVDVDGVLADFATPILAHCNRLTGRSVAEQTTWNFRGMFPGLSGNAIYKPCLEEGFCASLSLYHWALEGLTELRKYARVVAVTSPWWESKFWQYERTEYLRQKLGFETDDITFSSSKELVRGDFLVEDKPETVESWLKENPGKQAFLWDRPYNRNASATLRRVDSWAPIVDAVRRRVDSIRPLKPNEIRDHVTDTVIDFAWEGDAAIARDFNRCIEAKWSSGASYQRLVREGVYNALVAWASRPENIPAHIAIVDGVPYVMRDDQYRGVSGHVLPCAGLLGDLDSHKFAPGQRERVEAWRNGQLPPLKPNEWRGDVMSEQVTLAFRWEGSRAYGAYVPARSVDCLAWPTDADVERYAPEFAGAREALRVWATRPENLPHHIAIVDGKPYVMKEDEARATSGRVHKCGDYWVSLLDNYDFAPGQRERVEKWRASQAQKEPAKKDLTIPSVEVSVKVDGQLFFNGHGLEFSVHESLLDGSRNLKLSAVEHPKPKPKKTGTVFLNGKPVGTAEFSYELQAKQPLGENELERLSGARDMVEIARVDGNGHPEIVFLTGRIRNPWDKQSALVTHFVTGSADRAKRIFYRLYKFRDDEGVDATTGKLRTMAINEARWPETGEILQLMWLEKERMVFGNTGKLMFVLPDDPKDTPITARCIAYRDHVLSLEKQLEDLKGKAA